LLILLPTPIGNLEDITIRALKALENADIFLCEDTRVTKKLLNLLKEKFSITIKSSKFISFHEHNQYEFLNSITPSFFDKVVVYVSDAGMPGISDPGASLVKYCQKNSIKYEVLPGPSAAITAFVASGFEEGKFTFYGFLPHKGKEREESLNEILNNKHISILYEAPHRILKLLEEISKKEPNKKLFLAKELTKKYQKFYKDTAQNLVQILKKENIKGEWVVVVSSQKKPEYNPSLVDDILKLDIPKKQKAKLLSKITPKSAKEWYEELIEDS